MKIKYDVVAIYKYWLNPWCLWQAQSDMIWCWRIVITGPISQYYCETDLFGLRYWPDVLKLHIGTLTKVKFFCLSGMKAVSSELCSGQRWPMHSLSNPLPLIVFQQRFMHINIQKSWEGVIEALRETFGSWKTLSQNIVFPPELRARCLSFCPWPRGWSQNSAEWKFGVGEGFSLTGSGPNAPSLVHAR